MSVEIAFPIEFVVEGTPVSLQSKNQRSRGDWQARVRNACRPLLPQNHFASDQPIAVTLYYFPRNAMQGDIDNIVKPLLDALSRYVYRDDRQVQRLLVQKFEPDNLFDFAAPSIALADAMTMSNPGLYVRLSTDPSEDLV